MNARLHMRLRLTAWSLVSVTMLWVAWYGGLFGEAVGRLTWLAHQPGVSTAFTEPEHGRVDALVMLLSFFLLAPLAVLLALVALIFVLIVFVLMFEPILRLLRLPEWVAVPVVVMGSAAGAWATTALWLPQSLHVIGLVARAWLVYFSTIPAFPR
jgi:hypothetical protein